MRDGLRHKDFKENGRVNSECTPAGIKVQRALWTAHTSANRARKCRRKTKRRGDPQLDRSCEAAR